MKWRNRKSLKEKKMNEGEREHDEGGGKERQKKKRKGGYRKCQRGRVYQFTVLSHTIQSAADLEEDCSLLCLVNAVPPFTLEGTSCLSSATTFFFLHLRSNKDIMLKFRITHCSRCVCE